MAVVCAAALLVACGSATGSNPSANPGSTPTVPPSPLSSPSPSLSPSESPSPSISPTPLASPIPPAGFVCAGNSGGSVATSTVTTARLGQHPGYDRFVIEFGGGVPSYTVTPQSTTVFSRSPRGDQVTLEGSSGALIVIHSITNWTTYTGPTSALPRYASLRQVMQVENFEGYQQWALGLEGTPCLRVSTLASPSRLVVDIAA